MIVEKVLTLIGASVSQCNAGADTCETNLPNINADPGQITNILQLVFGFVGVIALFVIIVAGFQLSTSLGSNPEAVAKARKTLIYAVMGLLIAISARFQGSLAVTICFFYKTLSRL